METPKNIAKKLPRGCGVYIFKNTHGKILYIGKANNLRSRVLQYFEKDDAVGEKTSILVSQIHEIKTILTDSEFDALLLESKLIRTHLPKYNVIARDDKSPLYITITSELLPRILWLRKTSLSQYPLATHFGPFQSGSTARFIMRQLRYVIPYCMQKQRNGKPCFYTHLGLCNPCPSVPLSPKSASIYRKNIRKLRDILSGKSLTLLHALEDDMRSKALQNKFEEAQVVKTHFDSLKRILERHFDPMMYVQNESFAEDIHTTERKCLEKALGIPNIHRIECIDISNTGGTYSTGSLVVFIDGVAAGNQYRRFKIRRKDTPNDVAMIGEVVRRRFAHPDWPKPDLLVVDGGKAQIKAAMTSSVAVIGLAKRFEEIIIRDHVLRLSMSNKGLHLLMRIRDESHRFALKYHKLLRGQAFAKKLTVLKASATINEHEISRSGVVI